MCKRTEKNTTYSSLGAPVRIDTNKINVANTCSSSVSFVPEENKHYEVYFGLFSDKCIIKASEARGATELTKQLFLITVL